MVRARRRLRSLGSFVVVILLTYLGCSPSPSSSVA